MIYCDWPYAEDVEDECIFMSNKIEEYITSQNAKCKCVVQICNAPSNSNCPWRIKHEEERQENLEC